MAERKATNKYYPPEWDPSKGSLNTFHGQHPLRERARKLDQGILIVRFELPYSVWCLGCDAHVGTGVRFNAEKKRVGSYYSTPILSFRMKCHQCSHQWEIRTDPKNTAYVVIEGAKQKVETWDPIENGTYNLLNEKDREKINSNTLTKLEHKSKDLCEAKKNEPRIMQLQDQSDILWGDIYKKNKLLRKKFREEKKIRLDIESKDLAIINNNGLNLNLLKPNQEDAIKAKLIDFNNDESDNLNNLKRKLTQPLFKSNSKKSISPNLDTKSKLKHKLITNTRFITDPFIQPINNITKPKPKSNSSKVKNESSLVNYDSSDDEK